MTLVLGTLGAPVAAAHEPYFKGYAAPVALPGGDSGQLRKLYGDGIVVSDPVRVVVIDKQGSVRALGPVGYAAEFSCTGSRCSVYVYNNTALLPEVYRFDPASTRSTDLLSVTAANGLDTAMRAEVTYGFVEVPGLFARVTGALVCFMQWWPSFIVLMMIGASAVPVWMCLVMAFRPKEENRLGSMMLAVLCAVAITLPMVGLYLLFLFTTAYPPLLSLIAVCLPTLGFLLLRLIVRKSDNAPAAASA